MENNAPLSLIHIFHSHSELVAAHVRLGRHLIRIDIDQFNHPIAVRAARRGNEMHDGLAADFQRSRQRIGRERQHVGATGSLALVIHQPLLPGLAGIVADRLDGPCLLYTSGVAAGVRRIEAVTGKAAFEWLLRTEQVLRDVASMLRGSREDVDEKVRELVERSRRLEKEVQQLKSKLASGQSGDLSTQAKDVGGVKVLAALVEGADAKSLRDAVDQLRSKLGSSVIVLATVKEGKVVLVAGVSADLLERFKAGDIVGAVAAQVGGRGGGRADFAQAGGTQPENLSAALLSVEALVRG